MIDLVFYTGGHVDGDDSRRRVSTVHVGVDGGPAAGRGASVLRAAEPNSDRGRLRCIRRRAVCAVLRADGPAESGAGPLFPSAAGRVLRRTGLGAGHRVADGGFTEPAVVSASGAAGAATRPLDTATRYSRTCRRSGYAATSRNRTGAAVAGRASGRPATRYMGTVAGFAARGAVVCCGVEASCWSGRSRTCSRPAGCCGSIFEGIRTF